MSVHSESCSLKIRGIDGICSRLKVGRLKTPEEQMFLFESEGKERLQSQLV